MSDRIKRHCLVLKSIENAQGDKCVDIFSTRGAYGFEEFRRDSEDLGKWTAIGYYSALEFATEHDAVISAKKNVGWFAEAAE